MSDFVVVVAKGRRVIVRIEGQDTEFVIDNTSTKNQPAEITINGLLINQPEGVDEKTVD